ILLRQQRRQHVRGLDLGMACRGGVLHRSADRLLGLGGQLGVQIKSSADKCPQRFQGSIDINSSEVESIPLKAGLNDALEESASTTARVSATAPGCFPPAPTV